MATAEFETESRTQADIASPDTSRPRLITAEYWAQFAEKNAEKKAKREENSRISDQLQAEQARQTSLLKDTMGHLGSFVVCTTVDGRAIEGNFTQIIDGVTKLPVPERRRAESISLPRFVIFSPEFEQPQDLRLRDLASVAMVDPQPRPLVWQGDNS